MSIDLYYWPMGPGRGEYIRLVLEAAGADYRDVARLPEAEGGGIAAMTAFIEGKHGYPIPFAPPFLVDGDVLVSQSAEAAAYVGEKLGLAPEGERSRLFARAVALTTADFVAEVHDVHHPVGSGLYYEDQKEESKTRAKGFREERIPKFLSWYEQVIDANPAQSGFLVGDSMTYADLGLFQSIEGLRYAFPRRMKTVEPDYAKVVRLRDTVASDAKVAAYLASDRRLPFNESGIFRHYPELDAD